MLKERGPGARPDHLRRARPAKTDLKILEIPPMFVVVARSADDWENEKTDTDFSDAPEARRPYRHLRLVYCNCDIPDTVRAWPLEDEGVRLTIGRNSTHSDVALRDHRLSRAHLKFEHDPVSDSVFVSDIGSRNGTFVDGVRIEQPTELEHGSVIRAGLSLFVYVAPPALRSVPALVPSMVAATRAQVMFRATQLIEGLSTVLVLGENGVGKEHFVEALHRTHGPTTPLIIVDCGSIPANLIERELFGAEKGGYTGADESKPGLLEAAHGGTLLLDEIGDLEEDLQVKLLRFLESRTVRRIGSNVHRSVNARVFAATNKNLREMVEQGSFRQDLYYRLNDATIVVPPLRERKDEVLDLFRQFLGGGTWPLKANAAEALLCHTWPGNVRELQKAARYVMAGVPLGQQVTLEDLPDDVASREDVVVGTPERPAEPVLNEEARALHDALVSTRGNVKEASLQLGLHRNVVYRMCKAHRLDLKKYRAA